MNHIRHKVRKLNKKHNRVSALKIYKKQDAYSQYADLRGNIMFWLLFTNGRKIRVYSDYRNVFKNIRRLCQTHSNYFKETHFAKMIYIVDENTDQQFILKRY